MDNKKLASQLLTAIISKLNKFQKNDVHAESEDFPELIPPIVPSFVACCTLVEVDFNNKKLVLLFSN